MQELFFGGEFNSPNIFFLKFQAFLQTWGESPEFGDNLFSVSVVLIHRFEYPQMGPHLTIIYVGTCNGPFISDELLILAKLGGICRFQTIFFCWPGIVKLNSTSNIVTITTFLSCSVTSARGL